MLACLNAVCIHSPCKCQTCINCSDQCKLKGIEMLELALYVLL